eukprot:UN03833
MNCDLISIILFKENSPSLKDNENTYAYQLHSFSQCANVHFFFYFVCLIPLSLFLTSFSLFSFYIIVPIA